jgi:alkylation response protein AidB-like acyl-CoA dehydrogenase
MSYQLTEEHRIFRDAIRSFAEKEIVPLVEEAEENETFPKHLFKLMADYGFLCPRYPEELGGGGADKIAECILVEELTRVCSGIAGAVVAHSGLGTMPIYQYGSEEQKERFLIPAIRGEKIAAFGLTEPNAGSDVASLQTRAERDGDNYIINGVKMFISNGPICDYVVVGPVTPPQTPGEGLYVFIFFSGAPRLKA